MPPVGTGSSGKGLLGKPPAPRYLQAVGRGEEGHFSVALFSRSKEGCARSSPPLPWRSHAENICLVKETFHGPETDTVCPSPPYHPSCPQNTCRRVEPPPGRWACTARGEGALSRTTAAPPAPPKEQTPPQPPWTPRGLGASLRPEAAAPHACPGQRGGGLGRQRGKAVAPFGLGEEG